VQSYLYDAFGNQTATTTQPVGSGTSTTRNTPTTAGTNRLGSGVYDARGNLTALGGASYEWDALGSLSRMRNGTEDWFYFYTADGERLHSLQIATGPSQQRLWALRDLDGKVLRRYSQVPSGSGFAWVVEADYIHRGDQLLAAETPQGRRHFHLDHLGTPRLVTNASGQQVSFHTYFPFGEEATFFAQSNERLKFTGHERDLNALGGPGDDLDYMHARYCSPVTGRFLSVDPAGESAKPGEPQTWNRYAYVGNNPLRFVDPDGQERAEIMLNQDVKDLQAGKINRQEFLERQQAKAQGALVGVGLVAGGVAALRALPAIVGFFLRPAVITTATVTLAGLADQPLPSSVTGPLLEVSKGNLKHIAKHLDEFRALDSKATVRDVVALGQRIAGNAGNFVKNHGEQKIYEAAVTIGDRTVRVRVVVNSHGGLRSVFIPEK
jgi:RHS repeat-associated protein